MTECESSSDVAIDIGKLEHYLNKEYWAFGDGVGSICKVQRRSDENVYDPAVVSIGPYHHKKDTLKAMEQMKWKSVDCMLKSNKRVGLEDYIKSLRKVEHVARSYYKEEIKMTSNDFINMLLLDGCFLLFFFQAIDLTQDFSNSAPNNDPYIEIEQLMFGFSSIDLFLIENQVPFFILKIIFGLFKGEEETTAISLSEKISQGVEEMLYQYPKSIKETNRPRDFHHLLHLCHMYLRPNRNNDFCFTKQLGQHSKMVNCWHKAIEYHIAGITIRKREFDQDDPHSLLDVRFTGNVLEIPNLVIDENTLSQFKNLDALELTNPKLSNDITAYLVFMSQLINNAKDVSLLVSKRIVEDDLGCEEEVADLFMRLSERIIFDFTGDFYLKNICHNLEVYYRSRTKSWNVWFRKITSAIRDRI